VVKIKSIFPTNEKEIELIKFIGRYQYLSIKDLQYFFNDTYYPKRITKLVKNNILRRYKKYLVLGNTGVDFLDILGQSTVTLRYQKRYADRLKCISHIAAIYYKEKQITFIPSFEIKEKTVFTVNSRRYIGVLKINGTTYLTYNISSEHTSEYINAIMYDVQKETKYRNIIILVNNISRINLKDFVFGLSSVLICENSNEGLEKLKYLQQIDWSKIICGLYGNKVHISEYNFCDYIEKNRNKYISVFNFIDTEKLNRIDTFLQNNNQKQADIICSADIKPIICREIPSANYININLEDCIEKERKVYE